MNHVDESLRAIVPKPIKRSLRTLHRRVTFRHAMKRFMQDPEASSDPDSQVFAELIYAWNNQLWSANAEYLSACVHQVLQTTGPILECGSGLSTILIGVLAKRCGVHHYALESSPEWADRVQRLLSQYALDSTQVFCAPLRDYGAFCWYAPPLETMPRDFGLVVCDGPHGATKGGRYGLIPIMRDRLTAGCVILLDDADRTGEVSIAHHWKDELDSTLEMLGSSRPYIKLTLPTP